MPAIHKITFTGELASDVDALFPLDDTAPFNHPSALPSSMALGWYLHEAGILCENDTTFRDDIKTLHRKLYRPHPSRDGTVELRWHEYGDEKEHILDTFKRFREGVSKAATAEPVPV